MNDEVQQDERASDEPQTTQEQAPQVDAPPEIDEAALQRRAELITQAREATLERPDLAALIDRITALDDVELGHHVSELDAVHRALREALAAAGRDDAPAS